VLVEELRRDLSNRLPLRATGHPDPLSWPRWEEAESDNVNFGEIWWSRHTLGNTLEPAVRVPLLAVSDAWEESGRQWLDVVPLSTDIENATSVDFVLLRGDTDLKVPLRVCLRLQTVASRSALDTRIGRLTASGRTAIQLVMAGDAAVERFGSGIEGADDPRVRLPKEIERSIHLVGESYAALQERDDTAEERGPVISFQMHQLKRFGGAAGGLRLAAASGSEEDLPLWAVQIRERGRIQGRLVRTSEDELFFVVEGLSEDRLGLASALRITIWSDLLPEPATSEPFVPALAKQVSLGRGHGVFPSEISRLEVRLSDER
jgi:hypothetical protein